MLTALKLENVRAFERRSVDFQERTVVLGANGSGKSTVIEAIRVLSVGKSFRTSRFDELIRFEAPYLLVSGERQVAEKKQAIEFFYGTQFAGSAKERQLSVSNKPIDWLTYIGTFPTVLFVPSDIDIVLGPPQLRRRYIDSILWQVDPAFRQDYLDFSRVLRERSALLFLLKIRRANRGELAPWNELIVKLTETIRAKRRGYIHYLQTGFTEERVADVPVVVEYQASDAEVGALQEQEIQAAQNLYGAHRDEIEILLGDRSARKFASRGQTRTVVVLLKAIEARYLAEKTGRSPLLLLDDMFSELDETNSQHLFESFAPDYQVILTAISPQRLAKDWPVVKL